MLTRFFLILGLAGTPAFAQAFAQTVIESSEQSNTGGASQAGDFSMSASIGGQPSPVGRANSGQFSLSSGYTFTLNPDTTNQLPAINHTPVLQQPDNTNIAIEVTITDEDVHNVSAILKYRRGGELTFQETDMTHSSGSFQGNIPADFITSRGVEYYVEATDVAGYKDREPDSGVLSIQVAVADPGVQKPGNQPNGSEQSAYRMISMPLDLDQRSPAAVLEDNLGRYDSTKWRLYDWQDENWVELPELPTNRNFTPGKAFFLIVKDAGKQIDSGPGQSNVTNQEFSIPLVADWNMVGNPFNFPIPVDKLRLSSGRSLTLWTYEGSWRTLNQTELIQPFEGYAIDAIASDEVIVNPDLSPSSSEVSKQSGSLNERFLWSIQILAQCQEARDTHNFAAVSVDANLSWDELDQAEPPPIGEYVMVCFPHRDWQTLTSLYSTDVRPEPIDGDTWDFEVKSNIRDVVSLSFAGLEKIPQIFEVWLVDDAVDVTQNLRDNPEYSFVALPHEQAKRLKLVVGKRLFIEERIEPFTQVPDEFELFQNFPNPFNPATTIRYSLPEASTVTLKIYNLLGEEVRALLDDEPQTPGYHTTIWDGRNKYGKPVAGGIYIYQIRFATTILTRKMILLH